MVHICLSACGPFRQLDMSSEGGPHTILVGAFLTRTVQRTQSNSDGKRTAFGARRSTEIGRVHGLQIITELLRSKE